jgi:hypothetical protein
VLEVSLVPVVGLFFNDIKGVYFETLHMWLSEGGGSVFGACCWFVLQCYYGCLF